MIPSSLHTKGIPSAGTAVSRACAPAVGAAVAPAEGPWGPSCHGGALHAYSETRPEPHGLTCPAVLPAFP